MLFLRRQQSAVAEASRWAVSFWRSRCFCSQHDVLSRLGYDQAVPETYVEEIETVKTLEEIKQWLVRHKSVLQEQYKVRELGIFGSYTREEQTENSDVDLLVEFSETPSLLKFVNLENYLSDNLGVKVDLVHKSGLKPRIGERILAEVVYL